MTWHKLTTILALLKESAQEWQSDKASRLAAALAYYTIFSLAPILIMAIAIAGSIFGEEAAKGEIVQQLETVMDVHSASVIESALKNAAQPDLSSVASWVSVGVLLFAASNLFSQIQDALNTIWEVEAKPGRGLLLVLRKRILSFLMVFLIGLMLVGLLVLSATVSALSKYGDQAFNSIFFELGGLWELINSVISFGVVTILFALVYKILPDVKIAWKDVWVGSMITSILFILGKSALGWYLGRSSFGSTYGAAGSILVLLFWVYYSAQIFFFGAEFTQVYARRYGNHIQPSRLAQRTTQGEAKRQRRQQNSEN